MKYIVTVFYEAPLGTCFYECTKIPRENYTGSMEFETNEGTIITVSRTMQWMVQEIKDERQEATQE
jgi:hypothetical protein